MQENDTSRRRKFYDQMSEAYDLGSYEEFNSKMDNADSRRKLYDFIDKDGKYDIGDFDYFDKAMQPAIQEEPASSPQTPSVQGSDQPTNAIGNPLYHNGEQYSQAVIDRYNSPENKAPNFRDLSQIANEIDREQSVSRMRTTGGAGYIPPQQFQMVEPQQPAAIEPSEPSEPSEPQQPESFTAENPSPMQPEQYQMPLMFKDKIGQQSQDPNITQQWIKDKAEAEAMPGKTGIDFAERMAALEQAGDTEGARLLNRNEFDKQNFDKFYEGHIAPVFGEERQKGEQQTREAVKGIPRYDVPGAQSGFARMFESSVAEAKFKDPEKIANATLRRVQDDNSEGGFGDYILSRMGINGGGDGGDSPQLSDREKEWMKKLFSKETEEVTEKIINRIYDTYKQENTPKNVLDYISGKAFHENMAASLYDAMVRRAAGSSGIREQLRAMASEEFGRDQSWLTRMAGGAAPFAVDMLAGGFALPNAVGRAVTKGGAKLAAHEVTKQMERRAVAAGLKDEALRDAVKGGAEVAERYLATQAPILNLAIRAAGSAANFATYDVQSEIINQIANGELKPFDLMKAATHGAILGGTMGAAGGVIGHTARNASHIGKIAAGIGGLGAETTIFGISNGLQKAYNEGLDVEDVDWADTAGEAFGQVVGMKTVGAVMHPKEFLNRYRKSKDYDVQLNQRDLDNLKAAGYDFDGIFKGLGKFGETAPMEANVINKAKEYVPGTEGTGSKKSTSTEEAWVDADTYKDLLSDPRISSSTKRKIVYVATGKLLMPEPVFGVTMNVDDNGKATVTTTNAYGDIIETKDYSSEEKARKDYDKLQGVSRINTIDGLENVAEQAGFPELVDVAKGRTLQETGEDVDEALSGDMEVKHASEVLDNYVKNLQEAYMERFNDKLKKIGEAAQSGKDGGDTVSISSETESPVSGTGEGGYVPENDNLGTGSQMPEQTERREAAYNRGAAIAENEADLTAIGHEKRLATARLMQQMPDDDPQASRIRNSVMQAVTEGDDAAADQIIKKALNNLQLTPQQLDAIEQWRDAVETERGIEESVLSQAEQFEKRRRAELEAISDPQGNVTQLQLKDGSTVYYKSGDLDNHFGGVFAVDENGKPVQVPVRDIANVSDAMSVEDIISDEVENFADGLTYMYQGKADGTILNSGQQVNMIVSGQPITATVIGTDAAGNTTFQLEDGSSIVLNPDDVQQAIEAADNARIQQTLQAEAESARLAEQQQRFVNGIAGFAEGQPDITAATTDPKAAAEYIATQFGADGADPEKARKQYVTDIQNTKDQLRLRQDDAIQELNRLNQWLAANEDISDAQEVELVKKRIADLQAVIKDIETRQQKWGEIRQQLMTKEERTKLWQDRLQEMNKANAGYEAVVPERNFQPSSDEGIVIEDGKPNFGMSPVENVNDYLLRHFEDTFDAKNFIDEQRRLHNRRQRDEVQPEIDKRNDILKAYADGKKELTPEEVKRLRHEVADYELYQDELSAEALRLKNISDGITKLYERNGREEELTPAEQRAKDLEKATSREEKLTRARNIYNVYPEAIDVINDQEPRDIAEYISQNLGLKSINWEGYERGDHHVRGLQEELGSGFERGIGKGYSTNAFNMYLAPEGEGKGVEEIVHDLYEAQPDIADGKQYTTEDLRNGLIDLLTTAQRPSDISHRIIDNRIAEAESIVQRQEDLDREAEEEAKYQELQEWADAYHLTPEEVDTYQDYLAEKPWEFDEEVINQIIADDESDKRSKEMDSQHPDRTAGVEGKGGEEEIRQVGTTEGTGENTPVESEPRAEGGAGGETLPDNNVSGGEQIQGLEGYTEKDVTDLVRQHFEDVAGDTGARIVDIKVIGSRANGTANDDSDIDALLEYEGDMSEDGLFNILNDEENRLFIEGIPVDINPITKGKSGSIAEFLERNKDYKKEDNSFPARLAEAKAETDTNPTEAQKKAGNYKMGHISFGGYRMSIENPKGSVRSGVDNNGNSWSIEMQDTYGYIGKKYGSDGDHLDFFINDNTDLDDFTGRVYVVDQKNEDGTFDESKVMYGYPTWSAARKAYERNYEPGWWDKHVMQMIGVKKPDFDKWLDDSNHKTKPFADYYRTKMSDTVSSPADQVMADIKDREDAARLAEVAPTWDETKLAKIDDKELEQLQKKAKKDLSTSRYLLKSTDSITKGSKKEKTLLRNIVQAEADIKALDAEIERRKNAAEEYNEEMDPEAMMVNDAAVIRMSKRNKYGLDENTPIGKALTAIKEKGGENVFVGYRYSEEGDYIFAGNDAKRLQNVANTNKGVLSEENGTATLTLTPNEFSTVAPRLTGKGYKLAFADYNQPQPQQPQPPKKKQAPAGNNDSLRRIIQSKEKRDADYLRSLIWQQQSYIDQLRKQIPQEQNLYKKWQDAIGTKDEEKARDRYDKYYGNHEMEILELQKAEQYLDDLKNELAGKDVPTKEVKMEIVSSPIKSVVQGELFTEKDFEPLPDVKNEKGKSLSDLSDDELLKGITEKDGTERREYIDVYDLRHQSEQADESDAYSLMLWDENTSLEDAYAMYDGVWKQFKDGGYATAERTKLLAQIDALEDYIEQMEFKEYERQQEETGEGQEIEKPEAQQKFEQQEEEVRQSEYDLTQLRLRPLKKGESCHVERRYVENGMFNFTGTEHISSLDDVAYIFRSLEDAAVENTFMVLEKNGMPTIIHLAMGDFTSAMAPIMSAFAAAHEIDPDKVYFVHNHPSGNLTASRADKDLYMAIGKVFGNKLKDAIIIDTKSGKYGLFNENSGDLITGQIPKDMPDEIPLKIYQFSQQVFDKDWNPETAFKVTYAKDVAKFISSHRLGDHKKMSLIVMDQAGHVTGNVFLPWTKMKDACTPEAAQMIATYVSQMGGTRCVLYGNYDFSEKDSRPANQLVKMLRDRRVYLQDVLHLDDHSMHDYGQLVGEPEPESSQANESNVVKMNSKSAKMPDKEIEDLYTEGLKPGDAINMQERVNNMSPKELVEQYERLNSQMLDENGLNVDEQEEKFRQQYIAEHGREGFGKAMADWTEKTAEKYTYNKMALRWDILDRIKDLGLESYIDKDQKEHVDINDLDNIKTAEFVGMYRHSTPQIEKANNRFNAELQQQINGSLPANHIYQLGKPGSILLSTGFPNDNIELSASHLLNKSKGQRHKFSLADVKNLVKAINNPIAVFDYGDKGKAQNVIAEIQKDGKNFVVGIHFNQNRRGLVVSDIRGLFPKDNAEWLNWISQGKMLYVDKEKIQDLIDKQRMTLAEVDYLDLDSVAKIVKDFDNPTLSEEKLRNIYGNYAYAADETADMLGGVKVTFEAEAPEVGTLGWYDPNDNTVHVVLPEHTSIDEIKRTVCHEKLGHEGLVALLGGQAEVDKFGQFIFKSADKPLRQRINEKANEIDPEWKDPNRFSHAAQEVFADIAADGPRNAEEFSLWRKVKHYLIRLLNRLGLRIRGLLNDHDMRYYVLKTGEALKRWNQMSPDEQKAAARQETDYDLMRSRRGRPRKRNAESMAQYLQRLRDWEMLKIAEEQAAANNDPMPDAEKINEKWHEKFNHDLDEWKRQNNIESDAEGLGEFPKRKRDESPQEYAMRVADYETKADAWRNAPSLFDYLQQANDEFHREYAAWKERYGIREAENVDLGLYEGDPDSLPHIVDPEDLEADVRATADLAEAVGIDMSSEGARNHAKLAVIERRKNLESANAEDAIWIHNIVKQINEEAKRQGVSPKELREAMADIIEGTYFEEVIKDEAGNVISIEDISDSLSIKKTPGLQAIMDEIKDWYDYFFHDIEDAGLRNDAGYIEQGYVNHVWSKEKSSPEAWKKYVENYQRTKSPNMRDRLFETYRDGRDVGLVPKYSDIADILAHYSSSNNEAIANKKFLDDLSFIVVEEMNTDGEVVSVLPLLNSHKPNIAVEDRYSMYHVPGFGDVWVLNDVKKRFANVFGSMRTKDVDTWLSKSGKVWDTVGSTAKAIQLAWSGFHALALWEVSVAQNGPIAGLKDLLKYIVIDSYNAGSIPAYAHPDDFRFAASHLVQLGATQDYSSADVRNITGKLRAAVLDWYHNDNAFKKAAGVAGSVPAILLDAINKGFDKVLWNYLHDGLKISAMMRFKRQIDKRAAKEGLSDKEREQLYDEAGQYVNDMFGGQYFELLNISPASIKWLRRLLLSPDWLISTNRHFFANFGFGSLYNESGFLNYLRYNADNIRRAFGARIPRNENRRFRSRNAKLCYLIGVGVFWNIIYNALNMLCRHQDEQTEKEKADEIRKTNPEYKSPYELKYPDGMKWYDYTMYGNTLGQQTHLFTGRYKDGTETYVRWGKQFREFPELFLGRHGWELPTPLIERMKAKANPNIGTGLDVLGALGVNGFEEGYQNREIREKYGRTVSTIAATFRHFIPFGVPTQTDKEYKALDFFMPSSKGFSRWKAIDYFKTFIIDGDIRGVEDTYNAAVMNGIDAEECLKAAIATVKATQRKELQDGIVGLQSAMDAYDASRDVAEKKRLRQKIFAYLAEQEYKPFARDEAREQVQNFLSGDQPTDNDINKYVELATSADVRDEYRLDIICKQAKKFVDEVKTAEGDRQKKLEDAYGNWLDIYDIINGANRKINGLKKWLGKEGEDDAAIMKDIRDVRQQAQEEVDEIKAP